jgi:hypothetical protein
MRCWPLGRTWIRNLRMNSFVAKVMVVWRPAPLTATLHRYVWLYNQQLPQSALGSKMPLQAMKDWHKLKPELFKKQPYYRPGCDT